MENVLHCRTCGTTPGTLDSAHVDDIVQRAEVYPQVHLTLLFLVLVPSLLPPPKIESLIVLCFRSPAYFALALGVTSILPGNFQIGFCDRLERPGYVSNLS